MRKLLPLLLLGALLAVTAGCNGAEPITPASNVPTQPSTSVATEEPTSEPTEPVATPIPGNAACRTVSPIGVEVPGVPPVTADDYVIGPADAPVTFIEYADFQ